VRRRTMKEECSVGCQRKKIVPTRKIVFSDPKKKGGKAGGRRDVKGGGKPQVGVRSKKRTVENRGRKGGHKNVAARERRAPEGLGKDTKEKKSDQWKGWVKEKALKKKKKNWGRLISGSH